MKRTIAGVAVSLLCLLVSAAVGLSQQSGVPVKARAAVAKRPQAALASNLMPVEAQKKLMGQYCQGCHNDTLKSGGMTLTSLDLAHVERSAELAEKVIRKLRTGLMPPASVSNRPNHDVLMEFVRTLETQLDKAAALHPDPGRRPMQRLTRDEYARSIEQLLGITVEVEKYLPPDTISEGLDNIADSQTYSPALVEGYARAAAQISREALGDPTAGPASAVFKLNRTASQLRHVSGAPFGTRGGISMMFNFPADGQYQFRSLLHGTTFGVLFGNIAGEQLEVSVDGERVSLHNIDLGMSEEASESGLNLTTPKVFVRAGSHRVSVAFLEKHTEVSDDDVNEIEHTLASTDIGSDGEVTTYPHLRELEITGPFNATGVSDTPTRRKVFTCRPLNQSEQLPCATKIVTELARQAYRRPVNAEDMEGLMSFYRQGAEKGDFEAGVRTALQAILASPDFLFKVETPVAGAASGPNHRIGDLALASRMSYFLWGAPPDSELIAAATAGKLKDPQVLEKQVRRLIADKRSMWLATKFGDEWLQMPDLQSITPDLYYYPEYDHTLSLSMLREVELFFDSIVREDRNVLDLLTANYTFVDERLARHYGIPNIRGGEFQRIELTQDYRRGLLGKGGILALTSVADRTSPVQRGKWVLGVLLGTPPPPPPPLVPQLDETPAVSSGKLLTVRERMEMHRASPTCNSCHRMIDPIGLALENFDVTGEWRTLDKTYAISAAGVRIHTGGIPVDAKTILYDGTPLDGPASLRDAILKYSNPFIGTLTQKLYAFAIGRRTEYFDMPAIRAITRAASTNNNRFSSLILGIVKSPAFQMTRMEPSVNSQEADDKPRK